MIKQTNTKHAQAAFEFLMLIALLLTMYLLFNVFVSKETKDITYEKEKTMLKDLAYSIQLEVNFAQNVNNGYMRTLVLPDNLDGINYSLNMTNLELELTSNHQEYNIELPSFTGTLTKGNNTITKINDVVYISQP